MFNVFVSTNKREEIPPLSLILAFINHQFSPFRHDLSHELEITGLNIRPASVSRFQYRTAFFSSGISFAVFLLLAFLPRNVNSVALCLNYAAYCCNILLFNFISINFFMHAGTKSSSISLIFVPFDITPCITGSDRELEKIKMITIGFQLSLPIENGKQN